MLLNELYDSDSNKLKSDITKAREALDKGGNDNSSKGMHISRIGIEIAEKVINLREQGRSAAETVFHIGRELRGKVVPPQSS